MVLDSQIITHGKGVERMTENIGLTEVIIVKMGIFTILIQIKIKVLLK